MTEIVLMKSAGGSLVPVDPQALEFIAKMKLGAGITASVKRHNNPAFHRKLFALLTLAFDSWEPATKEYKGQPVSKEFNQFRRDMTIMAGYYDACVNFRGDVRLTAKSLNFSAMDQDEREALYSAVIDVVLTRILTKYTRDDLDNVVNQILGFV